MCCWLLEPAAAGKGPVISVSENLQMSDERKTSLDPIAVSNNKVFPSHCWWFRNPANQFRLTVDPIIFKVLYISGSVGFLTSTVFLIESKMEFGDRQLYTVFPYCECQQKLLTQTQWHRLSPSLHLLPFLGLADLRRTARRDWRNHWGRHPLWTFPGQVFCICSTATSAKRQWSVTW